MASSQKFKSVYFSDLPESAPRQQGLTVAFGVDDTELFTAVGAASSMQMREWLGHDSFASVQRAAEREARSVNSYCIRRLQRAIIAGDGKNGAKCKTCAGEATTDLGLLATFRGGTPEPLHEWYPYLEGYSPQFVERVLRDFAPTAKRVLDPFGGVGTTPLTVCRLGLEGYFCEVNPLLQELMSAKIHAVSLEQKSRTELALRIEGLAAKIVRRLASAKPDLELAAAHAGAFGESEFFDAPAFETVLRARTLLDELACVDDELARFTELAVLASLQPASRLIRRGDLRFKTPEELAQGTPELSAQMRVRLERMAFDLRQLEQTPHSPVLLCEDAKTLRTLPVVEVDAVVTSPPYLNGTNYFRNTKIELWFLRCLRSRADLAAFRARAVTAGINDVTVAKLKDGVPPLAQKIVTALERDAYDQRIPAMAANYFADMAEVIEGLGRHLREDGKVVLDIGDSSYGGVHVPTEQVLKELFGEAGFDLRADITLRQRASRSGTPLRQALLVFDRRRSARVREDTPLRPRWSSAWEKFKRDLPHQHGVFAKRNWGHGLHSVCSYQGKMKPALAHFLVKTFVPAGGTMLDPFGGVGTIPLEAALLGIRTWAFDISPAALHISRAKLARLAPEECERVLARLDEHLRTARRPARDAKEAEHIRFNGPLAAYFSEMTFDEILKARRFFLDAPPSTPAESLVFACLLHILHGNRPYALSRRSHPITPFAPTGPSEDRALIPRLREKVGRLLATELPLEFAPGEAIMQDACSWWPDQVRDVDAIITSPPFFDSTRFHLANWMRLWFCGWEADDFRVRPLGFVDERQKRSFAVYEPIFRQARERLKPGGVLVLHLGESRKCDMAAHLRHVARHWFRVADLFSENVGHCESHGIRDKGTVTAHQFLVLE